MEMTWFNTIARVSAVQQSLADKCIQYIYMIYILYYIYICVCVHGSNRPKETEHIVESAKASQLPVGFRSSHCQKMSNLIAMASNLLVMASILTIVKLCFEVQ